MITSFGREVRGLRKQLGLKMLEMARDLQVSAPYLSSMETGRRVITEKFLGRVIRYFSLRGIDAKHLRDLALESQKEVRISLENRSEQERRLVAAFARKIDEFDDERREQIRKLLLPEDGP